MRKTMKRVVRRRNRRRLYIRCSITLFLSIMLFLLGYGGFCYFSKGKLEKSKAVAAHTVTQTTKQSSIKNMNNEEQKQQEVPESNLDMDKGSNVNREGEKYSYDAEKVSNVLNKKAEKEKEKIIFLTFDDGPSTTVTPKILSTLKQYGVKATFFLIGRNVESNEASKELIKREFKEGNAIGNHTYTHDPGKLYPGNKLDVETFMKEVEKTSIAIQKVIGQDFNTRIIRMPGGYMSRVHFKDPNLLQFDERIQKEKMISIDWNAYDFDSEGKKKNAAQLVEEVKKSAGTQEEIVLLMHDTYGKEETAKALPEIIKYFKDRGYEFRTLK